MLSGRASAIPKSGDGPVEAIRVLELAHDSATHDRTEAINQFKSLLVRAPNSFRDCVGPHSAAQLLMTAGDNPDRLHSDAAFAKLCGACPQPASSGKTARFRLDRGGDRRANKALYRIVIRCLKRFVAREVFAAILNPPDHIPTGTDIRDARVDLGATMTGLAIALGVTPTKWSRLERGLEHNTARAEQALHLLGQWEDGNIATCRTVQPL